MSRSRPTAPKRSRKDKTLGGSVGPLNQRAAGTEIGEGELPASLGRLTSQVGYLLRRASSVFTTHWSHQLAGEPVTVTPVQCGMMILVDENPGLTQIELARLLKVEGSTLWQLVDRLLELGLIHRYRVPNDRRAFAIHLSRNGRQALRRFERGLDQHQQSLLACLSEKERKALPAMLLRVIEAGDGLNEKAEMPVRPSKKPRSGRALVSRSVPPDPE